MVKNTIKLSNIWTFGDIYNCGTYSAASYNEGEACQTQQNTGGGELLASTDGWQITVGIAAGILCIAIALAIIFSGKRRKKRNE